jgi:hypothetical protein
MTFAVEPLQDADRSANGQPVVPGEAPGPQIVDKGNVSAKFLPEDNRAELAQAESMSQRRFGQAGGRIGTTSIQSDFATWEAPGIPAPATTISA